MKKAVFLDKDGTLIEDVPYNVECDRIRLSPGALAGVKKFHAAGYLLVVVTNQSGIARGYFPETDLIAVESHLRTLLTVPLMGFYYCPHHPDGILPDYAIHCNCRKPQPGLLMQAAIAHLIDLSQSWMIGDILNDIEAGHRAGCRTVLIDNGNETEWVITPERTPDYTAATLDQAADYILQHDYEQSRFADSAIA